MNFQNTSHVYVRPVTNIGVRQQLQPRDVLDLAGGMVLWKAVGKVLLLLLPLVMTVNLLLASAVNDIGNDLTAIDNQRHQLMDKNIGLLAQKAQLYAPERVGQLAAQKLSLYSAAPGQIESLN